MLISCQKCNSVVILSKRFLIISSFSILKNLSWLYLHSTSFYLHEFLGPNYIYIIIMPAESNLQTSIYQASYFAAFIWKIDFSIQISESKEYISLSRSLESIHCIFELYYLLQQLSSLRLVFHSALSATMKWGLSYPN